MERGDEDATQESSRSRPWQARRSGAQRGQAAGERRKWPQEVIEIVIASVRARFGDAAIGLGDNGIRFTPTGGAGAPHARMA